MQSIDSEIICFEFIN